MRRRGFVEHELHDIFHAVFCAYLGAFFPTIFIFLGGWKPVFFGKSWEYCEFDPLIFSNNNDARPVPLELS